MIKSIISKTEGLCAKSGARLAAKSNMECEVLKMARNAKDVERECGQFLEKLERQYERAEDQQRRSKTTSATVTARMGEEPDAQKEAPKARAEAIAQEKAPRKPEIPQQEAPKEETGTPKEAAAESAAEPAEEKRIDAPDQPEEAPAD